MWEEAKAYVEHHPYTCAGIAAVCALGLMLVLLRSKGGTSQVSTGQAAATDYSAAQASEYSAQLSSAAAQAQISAQSQAVTTQYQTQLATVQDQDAAQVQLANISSATTLGVANTDLQAIVAQFASANHTSDDQLNATLASIQAAAATSQAQIQAGVTENASNNAVAVTQIGAQENTADFAAAQQSYQVKDTNDAFTQMNYNSTVVALAAIGQKNVQPSSPAQGGFT